jgi:16S rRNA (cytidine1402-2'-O)-methyltransferase
MTEALAPGLYVVSTPIGNVDDMSPRARRCLAECDLIAAEDTRVARTLLRQLGIGKKRLMSYYDHNEKGRVPQLMERLQAGARVCLVADQGTPTLADPGYRLINAAAAAGVRVIAVPGASAALAALVVSGLPTDRFRMVGFLPRRGGKRRSTLESLRRAGDTLLLFEAPHRVIEALRDCEDVLGDRRAALARSLTKSDESVLRGTLSEIRSALEGEPAVYGELTLVIAGADSDAGAPDDDVLTRLIDNLLAAGLSPRAIRDILSDSFSLPKAPTYTRILDRKKGDGP